MTDVGALRGRLSADTPMLAATVVVPTYGRPAFLKDALTSLVSQEGVDGGYEVVVVDNKPTGAVRALVAELAGRAGCRVICVEEPATGLHNARHAGARAARGRVLAYVDDDVIAPPGWLRGVLAPFADPRVGMVAGGIRPRWEGAAPSWLKQFPDSYLSLLDLGEERRVLAWPDTAYGANMAVRRDLLFEVGGFNPDAFGDRRLIWRRGDGETGLNLRIWEAGYKIVYEPDGWLWHRIPPERLEARAFCRRGFLDGISVAYSRIRRNAARPWFGLRAFGRGMRALALAALLGIESLARPGRAVHLRSDAWKSYAYGMLHLRAALSPSLRRWILRDCYLPSVESGQVDNGGSQDKLAAGEVRREGP